jgi:hypothetical protein
VEPSGSSAITPVNFEEAFGGSDTGAVSGIASNSSSKAALEDDGGLLEASSLSSLYSLFLYS